jgi:endosialidase-like protein
MKNLRFQFCVAERSSHFLSTILSLPCGEEKEQNLAHMKRIAHPLKRRTNRASCRFALLIPLALTCFTLSPQARAVCRQGCGTDDDNTFLGENALLTNTGADNTAVGFEALLNNTSDINTAIGSQALHNNTTGDTSTAVGAIALFTNTTGFSNNAIGWQSLYNNTTGYRNVANGVGTLFGNTTGNNNIALGSFAGSNLTTGSNNIDVANVGVAAESGTIRIGTNENQTRTFIAGIANTPLTEGVRVGITADGQLGVKASSARFKEKIKPMDKTSEVILALKPVSFHYKKDLDPKGMPQFGLVAEDVAKVAPDLVVRDATGNPFTVRYDEVNAMLLNEFLKARRQVDAQQKQIEALTAGLQKVSAQLELNRRAPKTVSNNH